MNQKTARATVNNPLPPHITEYLSWAIGSLISNEHVNIATFTRNYGFALGTINYLLSGKRQGYLSTYLAICKALGVGLELGSNGNVRILRMIDSEIKMATPDEDGHMIWKEI